MTTRPFARLAALALGIALVGAPSAWAKAPGALPGPAPKSTPTSTSISTATPAPTPTAAPTATATAAPTAAPLALPTLGARHLDAATGRYVASYGTGQALLTLDPRLQVRLERTLAETSPDYAATVLLDPRTGRILAIAEHSRAEPKKAPGLALRAVALAASIFKIVTAAALLEQGYSPDEPVCYHGGHHRLAPGLLQNDLRRDGTCLPLTQAFGHSANVVFAKLADRGLSAEALRATASRFLFNAEIPFASPVEPSPALIPADRFGLANTAAGFGEVRLSALHGALLAAVVANHGVLVPPWEVELVTGGDGPPIQEPIRVIDEKVAEQLGAMMRETVTHGTAQRVFARPGRELRGVSVAGKTGSLNEQKPFRDHTWFVGYAPADEPQVVVATVVVNGPMWRVRAPWVAKEALAAYFADHLAEATPAAPVHLARAPKHRR
jgi:cell division protein FtsI/penicillin-binding protein 2